MHKFPDSNREMNIKAVENGFIVTAICLIEHFVQISPHCPSRSEWQCETLAFVFPTASDVLKFVEVYIGYTGENEEVLDEQQAENRTSD